MSLAERCWLIFHDIPITVPCPKSKHRYGKPVVIGKRVIERTTFHMVSYGISPWLLPVALPFFQKHGPQQRRRLRIRRIDTPAARGISHPNGSTGLDLLLGSKSEITVLKTVNLTISWRVTCVCLRIEHTHTTRQDIVRDNNIYWDMTLIWPCSPSMSHSDLANCEEQQMSHWKRNNHISKGSVRAIGSLRADEWRWWWNWKPFVQQCLESLDRAHRHLAIGSWTFTSYGICLSKNMLIKKNSVKTNYNQICNFKYDISFPSKSTSRNAPHYSFLAR